jgi:hypothetical protein
VAGLHSETLVSSLKSGRAVNLAPEVLFHTYGIVDRVRNYLPVLNLDYYVLCVVGLPIECDSKLQAK